MYLNDSTSKKLNRIIEKDSLFLSSLNIMDYSMLLAIETLPVSSLIVEEIKPDEPSRQIDTSFIS